MFYHINTTPYPTQKIRRRLKCGGAPRPYLNLKQWWRPETLAKLIDSASANGAKSATHQHSNLNHARALQNSRVNSRTFSDTVIQQVNLGQFLTGILIRTIKLAKNGHNRLKLIFIQKKLKKKNKMIIKKYITVPCLYKEQKLI